MHYAAWMSFRTCVFPRCPPEKRRGVPDLLQHTCLTPPPYLRISYSPLRSSADRSGRFCCWIMAGRCRDGAPRQLAPGASPQILVWKVHGRPGRGVTRDAESSRKNGHWAATGPALWKYSNFDPQLQLRVKFSIGSVYIISSKKKTFFLIYVFLRLRLRVKCAGFGSSSASLGVTLHPWII